MERKKKKKKKDVNIQFIKRIKMVSFILGPKIIFDENWKWKLNYVKKINKENENTSLQYAANIIIN